MLQLTKEVTGITINELATVWRLLDQNYLEVIIKSLSWFFRKNVLVFYLIQKFEFNTEVLMNKTIISRVFWVRG